MSDTKRVNFLEKLVPILLLATIAMSFVVGVLWEKVRNLESGGTRVSGSGAGEKVGNSGSGTGNQANDNQAQVGFEQFESAKDAIKLNDKDHIRGNKNARILLIEYSDLECPFCKRFHPTAKQIIDEYKDQVAWVYRHFPLDQIHPKADKLAEAVECASELGGEDAFWKLTDKIFEVTPSNNGLNLDDLPKLAKEIGLDEERFKECLDSGKYKDRVEEDYQSGLKAGIQGTPGNILLDTKTGKTKLIPGAYPFETFKAEIDKLLSEN